VMLALVLTDAGFGIVSRVVPQMNVFAVGFPTKVLVGLLIVGASLPFMGGFVAGEVPEAITNAMEAVR
jgi:flagellar biosynthesis protein FliR